MHKCINLQQKQKKTAMGYGGAHYEVIKCSLIIRELCPYLKRKQGLFSYGGESAGSE